MATSRRTKEKVVIPASTITHMTQHVQMLVGMEHNPLTYSQTEQLVELLPPPFSSYDWYSEENRAKVVEVLKALVRALIDNQQDLVPFYSGAVASVYNRDRADRARVLVPEKPAPILFGQMPQTQRDNSYHSYQLNLQKVANWVTGIPHHRVNVVARIGQVAPPDGFYLATYIREYHPALPDPILYAKYGDWYVKLAEWK
jgi:hypothetical protein